VKGSPDRIRILVSDPLSSAGIERLEGIANVEVDAPGSLDRGEFLRRLPGHDALIVRSGTRVDREALDRAGDLRVVGRAGVGLDNIDVEACTARGVLVMNTPGANTAATAEHAWALLTALCRRIPAADASVRRGEWVRKQFVGTELRGKTLGIVGLGRVGRRVARIARAFGMEVLVADPYVPPEVAEESGVDLVDLDGLLAGSDVVTLHVPLTGETRDFLDADRIARMRRGALLVNAARGGLVDEVALVEALRAGRLGGAALDVYAAEPPAGSPLLELDNVILTPHLGASTREAQRDVSVQIVDQVVDALRNAGYRNAVNLPFLLEGPVDLGPWLDLAERMGALVGALAEGPVTAVEVEARGPDLADAGEPVSVALLKGLLEPVLGGDVNWVNAAHLAAERGIAVARTHRASAVEYVHLVACRVRGERGDHTVAGTLFHDHPRIVEIDGYHLDAPPQGEVLLVWNRDVPGVIGGVATLLGEEGVNIAEWRLGRTGPGRTALAFINLDDPVSAGVLAALRGLEGVSAVRSLRFGA